MFGVFINAWRVKEIRKKIIYTLLILAVIRLGCHISIPGIDVTAIKAAQDLSSTGMLYNIIAGGANSKWSIFAMGIGPYITSSIIMQLLTIAIPKFEQMHKEGEEGRKKLSAYSRYLTVILGLIQGIGVTYSYRTMFLSDSIFIYIVCVLSLMCGTTFIMWLAEQITAKGLSNGSSMVIFINIVSNLPAGARMLYYYLTSGEVIGVLKVAALLLVLLGVIAFIVIVHEGERRLAVQYSSKMAGHRQYGGQSTFMPIKVNTSGVISIIFAISLIQFPEMVGQFISNKGEVFTKIISLLKMTSPVGAAVYVLLIILFTYFYTSIVINPNEIAENMKKNGGFIPGIRPGQPTSSYITKIVSRITLVGAISYAMLALVPIILQWALGMDVGFGGTTLIIVVGVCLDIVKALESQLLMRHYKGFLNA